MISTLDWILMFGYLTILFAFGWFYAYFKYEETVARGFIILLMVRVFGGVLFAIIYVYYFNAVGDTVAYFEGGTTLCKILFEDPVAYFSLLQSEAGQIPSEYAHLISNVVYSDTPEEWFMTKAVSLVGIFSFQSFLLLNVLFGLVGMIGAWQLVRFAREFMPEVRREAYYIMILVPGILIWSSGLLKDTVTLTCFAYFLLYFCKVVFKQERKIHHFAILFLSAYIMFRIKPYVLICEIPALALATYVYYKAKIKIPFLRRVLMPALLALLLSASLLGVVQIAEASEKYKLETLEAKVKGFQSWHETLGGAYYSIGGGHVDYTLTGVLKVAPEALSHTFIRPFLWESRNASMLFAAVENTVILILLIICLRYYIMDPDLRKYLHNNHIVVFLFVFAVIFGFTVGFTSYNYGALARYKVPAQICFLFLLFFIVKKGRQFKQV